MDLFLQDIARRKPARVPGIAVFMTSDQAGAPVVLLHHLKHNKVLHETVILMSIEGEEIPKVKPRDRVELRELGEGFYQAIGHYGFTESPDVPALLAALGTPGLSAKARETSFYLGRETLIPNGNAPMSRWRKSLFIVMARNAQSATAFFNLPPTGCSSWGPRFSSELSQSRRRLSRTRHSYPIPTFAVECRGVPWQSIAPGCDRALLTHFIPSIWKGWHQSRLSGGLSRVAPVARRPYAR